MGDGTRGTGITRAVFLRRSAGGIVGVSSLAAFVSACGGDSTDPAGDRAAEGEPPSRPTGMLRVALAGDPTSLDPTVGFSVADVAITNNLYDGLVAFNEDYSQLAPALATEWDVSDDAREWTFTLREGVTFHDGEPFDSEAVRASLEYYARETSGFVFAIGDIEEIVTDDPLKVTIRYAAAFPDLARNCTLARILSPKLVAGPVRRSEQRVAEAPVGTGAFRFVSRDAGRSVRVEAFADHWGDGPYVQEIEYVVVPEESARVSALQAGDVDLVMQVPPTAVGTLEQDTRRARLATTQTWTTVVLNLATDLEPFNDVRVRQALAHAVDREGIVEAVLRGQARVNDSAMPPGTYGHREPSTRYAHDPARARELLGEAGHSGPVPVRVAAFSEFVLASELGQAIAAQLDEAGFEARFEVLDTAVAVEDMNAPDRKHQVFIVEKGWVNGGPFHFTVGTITAESRFDDKELAGLIEQMNALPDGPEREEVIGEAQEVVAREVPEFTLWVPDRVDGHDPGLQAYGPPKNVLTRLGGSYLVAPES
jgi:peptide/nickel transport system substrate-binding protein